jgi:hypothetical protein
MNTRIGHRPASSEVASRQTSQAALNDHGVMDR